MIKDLLRKPYHLRVHRRKRAFLISLACWGVLASGSLVQGMKRLDVDFEYVVERAEKLANRRYKAPDAIPEVLANLDYDSYQQIRYRNDEELWKDEGLPFVAGFFHLGYLYRESVDIHEFTSTHEQEIGYLDSFFDFGTNDFEGQLPKRLGYAGFRLASYVGNDREYREVGSFLGASYFRAVGMDQRFGSSARGLAINAGLSMPEEFPRFSEFWLGKPLGNANSITIYALLDSPSVTGAFAFTVLPGKDTEIRVKNRLFVREEIVSFGISPLTSMYWRGENRRAAESDYRPEVHDADGLLVWDGDEAPIWRPLDLDDKTRLSYFLAGGVSGFGLMQRDRDFDHYQDMEAEYHRRPSVWIEAKGDWGPGYVRLVELPTKNEFDDNIVAMWEPEVKPRPGDSVGYEYAIHWTKDPAPKGYPLLHVSDTRVGKDLSYPGTTVFVIDYSGGTESLKPEIEAHVGGPGALVDSHLKWNAYSRSWRAVLRVSDPEEENGTVELKCHLKFEDGSQSEVWAYQWSL